MKYYHALKNSAYNFRIDLGKLGFIFSLVAIGYVSSISNTPCLEAQSTCAVGSNPVFSENINIKGGTAFQTTIDGSNIPADRTLTLADADMDLSNALVATGALTNNTPLKIDSGGNVVTQDLVPESDLTIGSGTAGQMLAVNSGATALEFVNTYSPPVLTASKVMATDGTGAFSTTDVYPLTLTVSKVAKTDSSGNLTTGTIDITTDITAGTSLQQIRVNSGGTALEYFTPSGGGGRWTLVGQGQMSQSSYTMGACWYDDTQGTGIGGGLDQTKVYKLVVEPTGSMSSMGNNSSYPAMAVMSETNCSNIASSSNYLYASTQTNNGFWSINTQGWHYAFNSYANSPWLAYQQYTYANSNGSKCGGASIEMIIRNGVDLNGASANTKNEGVKITDMKVSAPCFDSSNTLIGWQQSDNSGMTWDSTQSYGASPVDNMNQMTGVQFKRYDGGGGFSQPVWYLYESNY